jgi:pyochelin biosynthetic protein PchC
VTASPWLRSASGSRPVCVVVFPHAGGAASSYRRWHGLADEHVGVQVVQYPGREDRVHDPLLASVARLAEGAAAALRGLPAGRLILIGNSFGGLVAYEVCRLLGAERGYAGLDLFVTACPAPQQPRPAVSGFDDATLVSWLCEFDAANEPLRIPELAEIALPSIRADLDAAANYEWSPDPVLDCPITALVGTEDPHVDVSSVQGWAACTLGELAVRSMPGGHFFVGDEPDSVLAYVLDRVRSRSNR